MLSSWYEHDLQRTMRSARCSWLAKSIMWTPDSSHTCPSPESDVMLMMVQTDVRLDSMATACCFKDIQRWRGVFTEHKN